MKIAWSKFFNSYIKAIVVVSDKKWSFQTCDEKGTARGSIFWAKAKHSDFDWNTIKEGNDG